MDQQEAIQTLLGLSAYAAQHSAGYATWGKVDILQAAIRTDDGKIVLNDIAQPLSAINESMVQMVEDHTVFKTIFDKRKNIRVILRTRQEYASQVKAEIPPILDDQAQLLGISVRIAASEDEAYKALKGRYAVLLPNGDSLCIGNTLEDAYVAAQLLEKTSKAFVEAAYLGGARSINKIEAWLMQQFYQLKYSKEAKKNK